MSHVFILINATRPPPTSLSSPRVPNVSIFSDVIGDAFALALVAYAISISLGKTFALKHGYKVDSNQVNQTQLNRLNISNSSTHTSDFTLLAATGAGGAGSQ